MKSDRYRVKLGAIATFINGDRGKNYPTQRDRVAEGIPFVNAADLIDGVVSFASADRISEEAFNRLSSGKTRPGDLLFCLRGSPGRVARNNSGVAAIASSLVILRACDNIDERYLFYLLSSAEVQARCAALDNGSAQPNVSATALKSLDLEVPPLARQRAIAGVLGALDDNIEQNGRTTRTLERLAQAIFRAWFVDFEPVKAKAAGATSFVSMPQPVFAALPTRFVDSDIGPVPEGWHVKPLAKCAQLTMGQSPPSENYNDTGDGLPFHQGVTNYGFRAPTHRIYCTVNSRLAEPQDVLLSVRAPVGRINVADRRLVLGRGLAGLRHPDGRQSFLFHLLRHVFAEEDAVGDGTIFKAITKQFLLQMPVLAPTEDLQVAYEDLVRPMDDLVLFSEFESLKLAEMRDYLLPRLLCRDMRMSLDIDDNGRP